MAASVLLAFAVLIVGWPSVRSNEAAAAEPGWD